MVHNIPSRFGKQKRNVGLAPPPPVEKGTTFPVSPSPPYPKDFWDNPAAQDKWFEDIARWNGTYYGDSFMGGLWSPAMDRALSQIPTPLFMLGEGLVLVRAFQEPDWLNKYTLIGLIGGLLLYRKETM